MDKRFADAVRRVADGGSAADSKVKDAVEQVAEAAAEMAGRLQERVDKIEKEISLGVHITRHRISL